MRYFPRPSMRCAPSGMATAPAAPMAVMRPADTTTVFEFSAVKRATCAAGYSTPPAATVPMRPFDPVGQGFQSIEAAGFSTFELTNAIVKAKVAGDVRQISVREGETVQAGQVLARIDTTDLDAKLIDRTGFTAMHALADRTTASLGLGD